MARAIFHVSFYVVLAVLLQSCSQEQPSPYSGENDSSDAAAIAGTRYAFTCSLCGSTMLSPDQHLTDQSEIDVMYKSPTFSECEHPWEQGIRTSYDHPLKDGTLVLVKQDAIYGAFIVKEQFGGPEEKVHYDWWYRTDGAGKLDSTSSRVRSGSGVCDIKKDYNAKISFGPFRVSWSGHRRGSGIIYYDYAPGEKVPVSGLRICVTNRTSIEGIDAEDPVFHYKATPVE